MLETVLYNPETMEILAIGDEAEKNWRAYTDKPFWTGVENPEIGGTIYSDGVNPVVVRPAFPQLAKALGMFADIIRTQRQNQQLIDAYIQGKDPAGAPTLDFTLPAGAQELLARIDAARGK